MTNENNAAQGKHLDSLAAATKRYILAQILDVTDAVVAELSSISGSGVLDTVCPSVDGGMWYEVANGTPVVKIYYGGNEYPLGSGALEPTLTVAPSPLNVPVDGSASATISCDSGGNYLVTSLTEGVTAELVDNVITVNHVLGIEEASIKIRVMASSGFNAAEILLPVAMAKASPNLTVTPSANIVPCAGIVTAPVSYSGGGTLSVSSDNANVTPTYDANTQTITVPYNGHETSATITVALTASTGYLAATQSFNVVMEEPKTILTITPSAGGTKGDPITATVECNSGGEISVSANWGIVPSYDSSTGTITLPWHLFEQDTYVTVTVSVDAYDIYPAAEKSFTFTYFGGTSEQLNMLSACMPFNFALDDDLCGNTLSISECTGGNTPQIENGVLHMTPLSGLICNLKTPFDCSNGLTASCWVYIAGDTGGNIFQAGIMSCRTKKFCSQPASDMPLNQWFHLECVFAADNRWTYMFVNGVRKYRYVIDKADFSSIIFGNNENPYDDISYWSQNEFYISNFKLYRSCLHTEDFTCPMRPPLPSIT